ncbi:uncharacterized protein LOC110490656 isoform X1 [Oncorhynchus mykiss]|uniref:uncharacterized protein LOC110490656 isoform X1 n=1 Tax=Oncorhynchus mykiss TaxID=8022 RepID=UPI001878A407|nr:uncharacterized protein LOC110490656 isoform X1 [Oncorhynchus mykiss]
MELKCIDMSKTPKAQSTLESIQLPKDSDDSLKSGSCEDSLIAEPHADQVDTIKASMNTEIHSVVTKATVVYANQPEALSSEVLLGTEGNGYVADHAVVGSLTPDCDLALVEGLDPGWHTALVLMETLVNPGNDSDLTLSDSSEVSLITDDLPVVDSAVDSRGQQRAEDDLQSTDQLLTRSCADCVTTEKHYTVPFEDSLNSDKEISLNIKDHDDRPAVDFRRDSVSSSDQSLSLVATALGSIVTIDSFNKALLFSNMLDQGKDNPIDQPVVKSQTTENLINPTLVSESIQPLVNEILEDNIISAPDDRTVFTTDPVGSHEIVIFISRMHLGSVITCHDDQFLESDREDDMVDPLSHTSHSHHLCESVMRPKGQVQLSGHTWSPSYETDDCRRYAQDHNMMEYKFKYSWDIKSAWVSVPHYILTRGESVTNRMEGEKKYGEKEWEKCSSQCDRNSLIEVIDGEEGPTGRKLEHQKARDSEEMRNSDGYVKMREIGKRKEVEVEVTKICTSGDEMSIMVLEIQGNARPMTDSQTPLKGKGKQQHSLPYKRTEGLQEEINSKGEMLEGGRQVNFPGCQAQKHRSLGVLGDVARFWRKEKRVHKAKDREEKDRVGQTWRDQGGNGREQWNGETERGGVGRSRRARQRGNQLLLFSRQKHSNWNGSHPSESSCDWRSREKEVPEKHVESRMDRQRGERPLKREKS